MDGALGLSLSLVCCLAGFELFAGGEEVLLKPVGRAKSKRVDGLQVELKAVKKEFGPGESVLLIWTVENLGSMDQSLQFATGSAKLAKFSIQATRGGKSVSLSRSIQTKKMPIRYKTITLKPGGKKKVWIDLRNMDWVKPEWLDVRGKYEVSVTYSGTASEDVLKSKAVRFRITRPGPALPFPDDADLTRKIQSLIKNLGAEDFEIREKAEKEILKLGRKTLGLLHEAMETTKDPEVKVRCKHLIKKLRAKTTRPPAIRDQPDPKPLPPHKKPPLKRPKPQPRVIKPKPVEPPKEPVEEAF